MAVGVFAGLLGRGPVAGGVVGATTRGPAERSRNVPHTPHAKVMGPFTYPLTFISDRCREKGAMVAALTKVHEGHAQGLSSAGEVGAAINSELHNR